VVQVVAVPVDGFALGGVGADRADRIDAADHAPGFHVKASQGRYSALEVFLPLSGPESDSGGCGVTVDPFGVTLTVGPFDVGAVAQFGDDRPAVEEAVDGAVKAGPDLLDDGV